MRIIWEPIQRGRSIRQVAKELGWTYYRVQKYLRQYPPCPFHLGRGGECDLCAEVRKVPSRAALSKWRRL